MIPVAPVRLPTPPLPGFGEGEEDDYGEGDEAADLDNLLHESLVGTPRGEEAIESTDAAGFSESSAYSPREAPEPAKRMPAERKHQVLQESRKRRRTDDEGPARAVRNPFGPDRVFINEETGDYMDLDSQASVPVASASRQVATAVKLPGPQQPSVVSSRPALETVSALPMTPSHKRVHASPATASRLHHVPLSRLNPRSTQSTPAHSRFFKANAPPFKVDTPALEAARVALLQRLREKDKELRAKALAAKVVVSHRVLLGRKGSKHRRPKRISFFCKAYVYRHDDVFDSRMSVFVCCGLSHL